MAVSQPILAASKLNHFVLLVDVIGTLSAQFSNFRCIQSANRSCGIIKLTRRAFFG